jgi:hypothetical protein
MVYDGVITIFDKIERFFPECLRCYTPPCSVEVSTTMLPLDPKVTLCCAITTGFAKGVEPHKDWLCPISLNLMVTPVVAADGYSYEKTAIESWFQTSSISPMDRSVITNKTLYKNTALMMAIQEWKRHNPEMVKKDQELDRQIELDALRAKPAPAPAPAPVPVSSMPRPYITQIGEITFPGWNVVQHAVGRTNRDNPPQPSPRSPLFTHTHTPRVVPM